MMPILIVIEEAHHVLLRREGSRETVMDVILREIRELGESVLLIDQHPSLISRVALGNTYCTIAMNLKHGRDVSAIGDALLLGKDQKDCLGEVPVDREFLGSAMISTPSGRTRFVYVTKKGELLLKKWGHEIRHSKNERPEHRFWKLRIAELLRESGHDVQVEAQVGSRVVDVLAMRDGIKTAVEVETGKSDAVKNIRGLLDTDVDAIVSVALTSAAEAAIKNPPMGPAVTHDSRVRVVRLRRFLCEVSG